MGKKIVLISLLFTIHAYADPIYQWVDANGVTHYSNQAIFGSKPIDLSDAPYSEVKAIEPPDIVSAEPGPVIIEPSEPHLVIVSPQNQATFQNTENLSVKFTVDSSVYQHKGQITLWVDGEKKASVKKGGSFSVENLPRGAHKLMLKALDSKGNELLKSEEITIYVHRPSILLPPAKKLHPLK